MKNKNLTLINRAISMLIDHAIMSAIAIILSFIMTLLFSKYSTKNFDLGFYTILFGISIYLNKDIFRGRSIGKRIFRTEVVDIKSNSVASPIKCLIRNLTIVIWPIEIIALIYNPTRRIGDLLANTRIEIVNEDNQYYKKNYLINSIFSLILGFVLLLAASSMYKVNFYNGAFDKPDYVETSYNKELSFELKNFVYDNESKYLKKVEIKVYDTINNDSLKFVKATFYLNENYFKSTSRFDKIRSEIFNSMSKIIPKTEFILEGKFVYNSPETKISRKRTYDWRKFKE